MIPSLQTLAFAAFAQGPSPETPEAKKSRFQQKFPVSQFEKMHSLICQQIINYKPGLLNHLSYFSDPFVLRLNCKIQNLWTANQHLSCSKIINLLLSVFPNLKTLDLSDITTIDQLKELPNIEELTISDTVSNVQQWVLLGQKFPHLKKFTFKQTSTFVYPPTVTYDSVTKKQMLANILKGLRGLPLEVLDFSCGPTFYTSLLPSIKVYLPHLKELSIVLGHDTGHDDIDDQERIWLDRLAGLGVEVLYIKSGLSDISSFAHSIPIQDLKTIKNLFPRLKKLDIDFNLFKITDRNGNTITSLEELTGLPIERLKLSSWTHDFVQYAGIPSREYLTLNEKFPHLKAVDLSCRPITGLKGLKGLPLEDLKLQKCAHIPQEEFLTLNQEFPYLKILHISYTSIASLEGLKGLPLEELVLTGCHNIPKEEFLTLNKILPHLKVLHLSYTSIASLEGLKGLPLTELGLNGCKGIPKREVLLLEENFSEIFPNLRARHLHLKDIDEET